MRGPDRKTKRGVSALLDGLRRPAMPFALSIREEIAKQEEKVIKTQQEAERLQQASVDAVPVVANCKADKEAAELSCTVAAEKLQSSEESLSVIRKQAESAVSERDLARSEVEDAAEAVVHCRKMVRRYGGLGIGSSEEEPPVAAPNASEMEHDPVASAAVAKLSERELGEMRKLARPPMLVRMALSLVQALIKSEDGLDVKLPPEGEETDWSELQGMLAKPDFIKRVLGFTPLGLSKNTALLAEIDQRWPHIKAAAGTSAGPRLGERRGSRGWANVRGRRGNISTGARGARNDAIAAAGMAAAIAAAAANAKAKPQPQSKATGRSLSRTSSTKRNKPTRPKRRSPSGRVIAARARRIPERMRARPPANQVKSAAVQKKVKA